MTLLVGGFSIGRPATALAGNPTTTCQNTFNNINVSNAVAVDLASFVSGYYSHLDSQATLLCGNPLPATASGSFKWVAMSTNVCGPGCLAIMQIGRGRCIFGSGCDAGPGQRLIVAWGVDHRAPGCAGWMERNPTPIDAGAAPTDTGLHYYRVVTDGLNWHFDHWRKGQAFQIALTLSAGSQCFGQRLGYTFDETWDHGDALGGSAVNHNNYLSMTRQETIGGPWLATNLTGQPCLLDPALSYFHCSVTASQAWESWTDH